MKTTEVGGMDGEVRKQRQRVDGGHQPEQLSSGHLEGYFRRLARTQPWHWRGQVLEAVGQTIESCGPICSVGECCEILDQTGQRHPAEVIGFRGPTVLAMPYRSGGCGRSRMPGWNVA